MSIQNLLYEHAFFGECSLFLIHCVIRFFLGSIKYTIANLKNRFSIIKSGKKGIEKSIIIPIFTEIIKRAMHTPLVSVIIPNYNHALYLKQRIETVLNQTFKDFEVIILDDASTDNSVEIIDLYGMHEKVSKVIINKINSGVLFKQWKKGLEFAKGKYIWIAESDDFAEKKFLEQTVGEIEKSNNISLIYTDSSIVNEKGKVLGLFSENKNIFFKTNRWTSSYINDGKQEVLDYLLYRTTINNTSAVLFRQNLLIDNKYLNNLSSFKNVGDLFTYISLCLKGEIKYISSPLNNYRSHSLNTTISNKKNGLLYKERIQCFSEGIILLFSSKLSIVEIGKLKKACKFIILKNSFHLIDYGFIKELKKFMNVLLKYKVLSKVEVYILVGLFNIYNGDLYKVNGGVKKIIKYLCK